MFRAAQFTIAKCWKQPKCPPVNEWIKKLVHLHNGVIIRRRTSTLCNARMELENIMLSEISQAVKDKYPMISPIKGSCFLTQA